MKILPRSEGGLYDAWDKCLEMCERQIIYYLLLWELHTHGALGGDEVTGRHVDSLV